VSDEGFLSRWSRRKAQQREGTPEPAAAPPADAPANTPANTPASAIAATTTTPAAPLAARGDPAPPAPAPLAEAPPPPTLADVAALTRESDFSRFVAPGVDEGVKRAAMKKLFSDPHFNVMDGLDTYIDDYNKPDPLPLSMLRQLNQSKMLRLFDDEPDEPDESDQSAGASVAGENAPEPGAAPATPSPELHAADDDHADLRLQPDDAAGRPGPREGPGA
jgi:hypothetical protein